jgi:uncharacterized membrane protein YphA (DoxX/SURF4 family)
MIKLPAFLESPRTPLFWLALLRIMVGLVFLTTWGSNLLKGFYTPDGLLAFFTNVFPQSQNELGFYASFINNVILPARAVFAPFQLVAEGLLAVALIIGLFTPFFSVAGIFFLINVFLATFGHDWPWAYWMPMGILGVMILTRSGRSLGVDGWLLKKYGEPKLPLW